MTRRADSYQVGGGSHYTDLPIQPFELTTGLQLGGIEHTICKYVSRWPQKGGVVDVRKAFHTNEFLIEVLMGTIAPEVTAEQYCLANGLGPLESKVVQLICQCARDRDVALAQEARIALADLITEACSRAST